MIRRRKQQKAAGGRRPPRKAAGGRKRVPESSGVRWQLGEVRVQISEVRKAVEHLLSWQQDEKRRQDDEQGRPKAATLADQLNARLLTENQALLESVAMLRKKLNDHGLMR